ncbi:hypothetical protein [Azospirillum sp. SYSU D00513]|uniref:hypothetical protein n=1 Tax=Azospirillum sp. SYSU D00513 TaxID=2812561 RepID=UPI001A974BF3|nr:hypothetical protein [Azospirillum sp. SYSU D00513]
MASIPTAATTMGTLNRENPAALERLSYLHPAFAPGMDIPPEVTLEQMAGATGLPLDAVLVTARGEMRVTMPEGGCGPGCSCVGEGVSAGGACVH